MTTGAYLRTDSSSPPVALSEEDAATAAASAGGGMEVSGPKDVGAPSGGPFASWAMRTLMTSAAAAMGSVCESSCMLDAGPGDLAMAEPKLKLL